MTTNTKPRKSIWKTLSIAATFALVAGCTVDESKLNSPDSDKKSDGEIQKQEVNEELRNQLPDEILEADSITSVNTGSFPPYTIVDGENKVTGASADLAEAMGQMLDVKINHKTIDGLASVLTGMEAVSYTHLTLPTTPYV